MKYVNFLHSIKSQLIAGVVFIHIVLMGWVVWDLTSRHDTFMHKQLSQKGYELSSLLAYNSVNPLLNNDLAALNELLQNSTQIDDLNQIFILNALAQVKASNHLQLTHKIFVDSKSVHLIQKLKNSNQSVLQFEYDGVIDTLRKIELNGVVIGYVRVILETQSLSKSSAEAAWHGYLYIVIATFVGGIFAFIIISRVASRLKTIEKAAESLSQYDFDIEIEQVSSKDELSKVMNAFGVMKESMKNYIAQIRQSKQMFEDIFNVIPASVFVKDQHLRYTWCNDLFLKILGESQLDKVVGKKDGDLAWSEYGAFFEQDDIEVMASKRAKTIFDAKPIKVHNQELFCIISKVPMLDDQGQCIGILGIFFDVSEHRKNEILLKEKDDLLVSQSKMASMGEMIANIAHQWRQPLSVVSTIATGIQMQLEMFGDVDKKQLNQDLASINTSVQFLSKTIDDFRNFLKHDNLPNEFLVDVFMKKVEQIITPSLKNNQIELHLNAPSVMVYTYENELMQIVLNLVNNAKDALKEEKNKDLSIKQIMLDTWVENQWLYIRVLDNGGGIDEAILNRIFEPYFTTKHQSLGTGLGLYMSLQIAQKLQGSLSVKNVTTTINNESFQGAQFIVAIPLEK